MSELGDTTELILAQTVAILDEDGQSETVELLLDAQLCLIKTEGAWSTENTYYPALELSKRLIPQFRHPMREAVGRIIHDLAQRQGIVIDLPPEAFDDDAYDEPEDCYVLVRPLVPPVDSNWRAFYRDRLSGDQPTNQARRERSVQTNPSEDGLVFGSTEELKVYRCLKRLQAGTPESQTIAIVPLPGARLRAGHVWTPDIMVFGNGRAVIIEVDGPHHRKTGRYGADRTRDLHWERCGVRVARILVEEVADEDALLERLKEELQRSLWPKP